MNNENYICEEAFEELVNGLEFIESLTLYGRKSLKYHIKRLQEENQQLKEQNERLLELCMYALISSTKIYNHELANDTKKLFIDIIKNNLNYDTYILKNKLLEAWRSDK